MIPAQHDIRFDDLSMEVFLIHVAVRLAVTTCAIFLASPLVAQDYLGSFLQTEQSHRVSELSQDQRSIKRKAQPTSTERQAAWSRHKKEYRKRLTHDGKRSADMWLDQQIRDGR